EEAVRIMGPYKVGVHLIVGLGETEEQMIATIQRAHDMGAHTHLFSFFAEKGSLLEGVPQPQWPKYLRVQLARYLVEYEISSLGRMSFGNRKEIVDFGIPKEKILGIVESGIPFMTTGCEDEGQVSCNRPFGNCLPGPKQWNYPYRPDREEIGLIKEALSL
ncbi:MAG: radical SAM protein, partial [Desulfatiglandales bacterium]